MSQTSSFAASALWVIRRNRQTRWSGEEISVTRFRSGWLTPTAASASWLTWTGVLRSLIIYSKNCKLLKAIRWAAYFERHEMCNPYVKCRVSHCSWGWACDHILRTCGIQFAQFWKTLCWFLRRLICMRVESRESQSNEWTFFLNHSRMVHRCTYS